MMLPPLLRLPGATLNGFLQVGEDHFAHFFWIISAVILL